MDFILCFSLIPTSNLDVFTTPWITQHSLKIFRFLIFVPGSCSCPPPHGFPFVISASEYPHLPSWSRSVASYPWVFLSCSGGISYPSSREKNNISLLLKILCSGNQVCICLFHCFWLVIHSFRKKVIFYLCVSFALSIRISCI